MLHENVVKSLRREKENMSRAYSTEKIQRLRYEAEAEQNQKRVEKLETQLTDVKNQNERLQG